MTLLRTAVIAALDRVLDPELHRSIVALGMVGSVEVDGGRVSITIKLTVAGCPLKDTINRDVVWSELGASGYGFVVSRSGSYPAHPSKGVDGVFVTHPLKPYWRGPDAPTFEQVAMRNGNEAAVQLLAPARSDPEQVLDYRDEVIAVDVGYGQLAEDVDDLLGPAAPAAR